MKFIVNTLLTHVNMFVLTKKIKCCDIKSLWEDTESTDF